MSESKELPSAQPPNRRKEIFRVARGSKLTGQRGTWSADIQSAAVADAGKSSMDDELRFMRRVRLGRVVEDEVERADALPSRRYSEPND